MTVYRYISWVRQDRISRNIRQSRVHRTDAGGCRTVCGALVPDRYRVLTITDHGLEPPTGLEPCRPCERRVESMEGLLDDDGGADCAADRIFP